MPATAVTRPPRNGPIKRQERPFIWSADNSWAAVCEPSKIEPIAQKKMEYFRARRMKRAVAEVTTASPGKRECTMHGMSGSWPRSKNESSRSISVYGQREIWRADHGHKFGAAGSGAGGICGDARPGGYFRHRAQFQEIPQPERKSARGVCGGLYNGNHRAI